MNTIREVAQINQQELDRGLAGTPASWHAQYVSSAWCYIGNLDHQLSEGDILCIMSQFGEIEDIHLVREDDGGGGSGGGGTGGSGGARPRGGGSGDGGGVTETSGKSRGFAFCKYEDARSCVLAVDNLVGVPVLGRPIRVDHVERYRLPKRLQEQEVENDAGTAQQRASRGAAGHAYKNVGLANQYNVHEGVDLFPPQRPTFAPQRPTQQENKGQPREGHHDDMGIHRDKEAKQKRKEERQRKREAKEKRRLEREAEREQMAERKRHKRSRQYGNDDEDDDDNNDDNSDRDAGNEEKISISRNNADSDGGKDTKAKCRKEHNRYRGRHHS